MRLSTGAFAAMTAALRAVADECCEGRLVLATEGGYDLQALAASLDVSIGALAAPAAEVRWPSGAYGTERGRAASKAARLALERFWTF
jgi:acetoin utilization deacetylase AcuC-like enzyme